MRQVHVRGQVGLFGQGTGHAQVLFRFLLRLAATGQQQQQQKQDHRAATHQAQQQRIGQQIVVLRLLARRWGYRFRGRRHSGHRGRLSNQFGRHCRIAWARGAGHGRCRWGGTFGLQLGQLVVFQFNQALELVQLALQVGHAAFQLGIVAAAGIEAFLGHRELVAQRLAVVAALAGVGRNQTQLVRLRPLAGGDGGPRTLGGIQRLRPRRAAALTPGHILGIHLGDGGRLRQGSALGGIRQAQDLAGFQAIDVAIDEGIGVQRLDRQHGLLDRTAIARLGRDFPEGVAGAGGVLRRFAGRGDRGRRRVDRLRWCRLGRSIGGLRGELGRVEQHAVITQQAAVGPHHLHQELDHGLGERFARRHPQHAFAARVEHRGETQFIKKGLAVDTGLAEVLRRGEAGHHFGCGEVLDVQQFDLCHQRLGRG